MVTLVPTHGDERECWIVCILANSTGANLGTKYRSLTYYATHVALILFCAATLRATRVVCENASRGFHLCDETLNGKSIVTQSKSKLK